MKTTGSILIDRGIEDVFRLTTECVEQWSKIVVEDEVVEDVNGGDAGTTFHTVTDDRGQRMDFAGIVTHFDPPHAHGSKLTGKSFDIDIGYTFEQADGGTCVTQTSDVTGKGIFGIFLILCGWMMRGSSCRALNDELESLKAFCESSVSSTEAAEVTPSA